MTRLVLIVIAGYFVLVALVFLRQRSLLFFPSHLTPSGSLTPWREGNLIIGYSREVPRPATIWLMLHGNAGQAADRDYVLSCLTERDSLYVLEYPGYGARPGRPSLATINSAASEGYRLLRSNNPGVPLCVLGESIGSGPASALAHEPLPPDKIVLVVPFDSLANVACKHFPFLPVRLMLRDRWDNAQALSSYSGPVEIFAAQDDTIIPPAHAKSLADRLPNARLTEIPGGHNDWSWNGKVRLSR